VFLKIYTMLNNIGTVIARRIARYVTSLRMLMDLTAFFSFSVLFMCLLADMVKAPPRIGLPVTGENAVAIPGAAVAYNFFFLPLRY